MSDQLKKGSARVTEQDLGHPNHVPGQDLHHAFDGDDDDATVVLPPMPIADTDVENNLPSDESARYTRFSKNKKHAITAILSLCGFLSPMSSTAVLSALPEVAETYNTTGTTISVSNCAYLVAMAFSPMLFGPVAQLYGRRWVMVNCALLFCAFSVATAVAPDLVSYYIFRICTAIQGTAFLVVGPACISDIFRPQERATAVSWFLSGTTVAPALAPFIGGVIVTYRSWRDIFWLQAALGGLAAVLLLFFLPETLPEDSKNGLVGFGKHARAILKAANPLRVFTTMYEYPSIFFVSMASSAVMWNQYSVLTPIRYVINPRFHLTSPAQSGLVYLVPGCGNLIGTFFGGRFADRYVKLYLKKKGRRVPEDRLRSCTWSMGLIIPACLVVYGWTITKEVGGMPVPLVALFVLGFFQMICIPSLNTYCLDVLQEQGRTADALSCNYFPRYIAAAVGTAVVIPAVQGIGLGWFCVITAAILVVTTFSVLLAIWKGEAWRATREGAIVLEN